MEVHIIYILNQHILKSLWLVYRENNVQGMLQLKVLLEESDYWNHKFTHKTVRVWVQKTVSSSSRINTFLVDFGELTVNSQVRLEINKQGQKLQKLVLWRWIRFKFNF